MTSPDQAMHNLFAGTATELHLLTAVQVINQAKSQSEADSQQVAKEALSYLRRHAAKGDVEAKIKLSTILDNAENTNNQLLHDQLEAVLWARSVFDKRLSAAITPCVSELILLTSDSNKSSLIDKIIKRAEASSTDQQQQQQDMTKQEKKILKNMNYLAGILFIDGTGVSQDVQKGISYLTRASELGHEGAGVELAKILGDPFKYPNEYDMEKSLELYQGVAERAASAAEGNVRRNMSAADARALTDLARVYYEGSETVPRDVEKAYRYARKVAESIGEQYCQFIVGDVLLNPPTNMKQDVQQSIFWLTQAGEQGFPLAIETLSRLYYTGQVKGVQKDYEQARIWCLRGDDIWPSGLGYCQTCLGDMFRQGLGVPRDLIRSFEYYQKAATQQDAPQNYARYMLGEM
ncbi:HCP-like protein [Backusella circina FSU 941]|nr:HCP-like protein [Backusella circina FSU 941]